MTTYAMVVVVEANDAVEAWENLARRLNEQVFIGDPWPVEPPRIGAWDEFDTQMLIGQR